MGFLETWHSNWDKVRLMQGIMDAILCIVVFFITLNIYKGSYLPALISSGLYCFSFYNIYYTRTLLSEKCCNIFFLPLHFFFVFWPKGMALAMYGHWQVDFWGDSHFDKT